MNKPDLISRDRTKEYITLRDSAKLRRLPRAGASTSSNASSSLLDNDELENGTGQPSQKERPQWMKVMDDANTDVETVKGKLKKLDKLHREQQDVVDFDDDVGREQQVEILSSEITQLMRAAQGKALKVKKLQLDSPAEQRIRDNMVSTIATKLQGLSDQFKEKQKSYLTRMQQMQAGDIFAVDDPDVDIGKTDKGFSNGQLATAKKMDLDIEQRSKEIEKIAKSVEELAGLFKDLALLIVEQGTILDRIEYNTQQAHENVTKAVSELKEADTSQKKSRMKLVILLLCVLVLIAVMAMIIKFSL